MEIRVRYAPSPTGGQHVGGLRTALFNYLFAKSQKGKFILRLEDTDRTRYNELYVRNLYDTFAWLGFYWDEGPDKDGAYGPYIQSQRTALYQKYAYELVTQGKAYYCFCSAERLETVRKEREAARSSETGYDRACRIINPDEAAGRAKKEKAVIRLKIPMDETTCFTDILLGEITWKNNDVNPDPVLLKSDGFPTYHLANVVDDHLMKITHVLRAQEWLASTPLHIIMYHAFGWEPPKFCHLPMVMGQDGKKLSKRHGATSIDEFRKTGLLSCALINYVALLGASYEEGKEIYTIEELTENFNLEKLNKAPSIFDYKKLEWFNAQYIKSSSDTALAAEAMSFALSAGIFENKEENTDTEYKIIFEKSMCLIKERVNYLSEIPEKLRYLFLTPVLPDAEEFKPKKLTITETIMMLEIGRSLVPQIANSSESNAEEIVKLTAEKENVKLGDLLMPLRVAITGSRISPPLFKSVSILGEKTSLERIDTALEFLKVQNSV
jgi:glutamyl-tRNA synthetase